jgi:hypothetical protein
MLASGTTLTYRISELASQTRASGARNISLQIRVIEQIPNTHFTVSAYSDDPGLLTLSPPPAGVGRTRPTLVSLRSRAYTRK